MTISGELNGYETCKGAFTYTSTWLPGVLSDDSSISSDGQLTTVLDGSVHQYSDTNVFEINVAITIADVPPSVSTDVNIKLIIEMCYSADYCMSDRCISLTSEDEMLAIDGPMSESQTFLWTFTMEQACTEVFEFTNHSTDTYGLIQTAP